MIELNITLFQFFNNLSGNTFIAIFSPILADLPIFFLPLFLTSMWIYFTYKKSNNGNKSTLLFIFYSTLLAIGISLIIQQFVDIDRPETAISWAGKLLLDHIPDASFPSDHASVSVAFLSALYLANYRKVFWTFLPWVILMNLSRIISGVHWPMDILAGTVVGIVWATISMKYLKRNKFASQLNLFIIHILSYIKL